MTKLQNQRSMQLTNRELVNLVCQGQTKHTSIAYGREIARFLDWLEIEAKPLSLLSTQSYKQSLLDAGKSNSAINLALAAIRFFVRQAATLGYVTKEKAEKIATIQAVKTRGQVLGNWLSKQQLEALLMAPHESSFAGSPLPYRDQAILAILGGGGLRRSEVAALKVENIVKRENRWILADITGKRGVVRSVPIASWIKEILDAWLTVGGITSSHVFRACPWKVAPMELLELPDSSLSDESIRNAVNRYAMAALGQAITSRDLRRSFAKVARDNGCPLEQIQFSLGHSQINTTQIYLGKHQNLKNAPSDYLHLEIRKPGE